MPLTRGQRADEGTQDRNWQNVEHILQTHHPELTNICRQAAFSAQHPYWTRLRRELTKLRRVTGADLRIEAQSHRQAGTSG